MAEVATSVLHNVGNVLNSVNISATLVADQVKQSKSVSISRVAALMREHAGDLGEFITCDPKGRQLPLYLGQLAEHLDREQIALLKELESLKQNIEHIKDIVTMQQGFAKISGASETINATDLVEDALRMTGDTLQRHLVRVSREYTPHPPRVTLEKHKALQILINLIRNAQFACDEAGRGDKRISIRVNNGGDFVRITIADNGVGIPPENLDRIFTHGFTTRKHGHGFGLHSSRQTAKELGGALLVQSEGRGKGATFTLELPVAAKGAA